MEITYTHAAGLDVHKQSIGACCFTPGPTGTPHKEIRTFRTMTHFPHLLSRSHVTCAC